MELWCYGTDFFAGHVLAVRGLLKHGCIIDERAHDGNSLYDLQKISRRLNGEKTLCGQALEHFAGALEPYALPAAQVAGHGRFLVEHLLRPLASFRGAALGS